MQPTRRFWTVVAIGLVLVAAAATFARPLLLVAAAAVFAYPLAVQAAFVSALERFDETLTVSQSFDRRATAVDEPATLSVSAAAEVGSLDVTVQPRLSPGLVGETAPVGFDERLGVEVRSPVAGIHGARPPEFRLVDPAGMFRERLDRGAAATLRVEPRRPDRIHIGEGGDTRIGAFGEHDSELAPGGVTPAEVREYVPGEPATRIDWKTTARLSALHVREFEGTTDMTTEVIVDCRGGLAVGPPGAMAIDHLRDAALRYLAGVRSINDPVGCHAVADDGIRRLALPKSTPQHYERVRRDLADVVASAGSQRRHRRPPVSARSQEFDGSTPFGETLAAYARARPTPVAAPDPLAAAVRSATLEGRGEVQVALFTDDADRAAIREAVMEARRADAPTFVFLAPRVLYEVDGPTGGGSPAARERARARYREFEAFRGDLSRVEGVRAYEVAPRDRFEAVSEAIATART